MLNSNLLNEKLFRSSDLGCTLTCSYAQFIWVAVNWGPWRLFTREAKRMGVPTPCLCRFDSGVMVAGVMRSLRLGGLLGSPILTKR